VEVSLAAISPSMDQVSIAEVPVDAETPLGPPMGVEIVGHTRSIVFHGASRLLADRRRNHCHPEQLVPDWWSLAGQSWMTVESSS
jgi:hypothetical protein